MKEYEMKKLLWCGILLSLVVAGGKGKAATKSPAAAIPWSQIGAKAGAGYTGDGLSVAPSETGARLHCVFQRLDGEATPQGLWSTSTVTNRIRDRFRVTAMEIGRKPANGVFDSQGPECNLELSADGAVSVKGQTVRFSRPGLTEEYTVSMDGVRQDFIVEQAPPGLPMGELVVKLAVTGAKVEAARYGAMLALENSGRKIAYGRLRVTDARGKELPARIEVSPAGNAPASLPLMSDSGNLYEVMSFLAPPGSELRLAVVEMMRMQLTRFALTPRLATPIGSASVAFPAQTAPFQRRWWMIRAIYTSVEISLSPTMPGLTASRNGTGAVGRRWVRGWRWL